MQTCFTFDSCKSTLPKFLEAMLSGLGLTRNKPDMPGPAIWTAWSANRLHLKWGAEWRDSRVRQKELKPPIGTYRLSPSSGNQKLQVSGHVLHVETSSLPYNTRKLMLRETASPVFQYFWALNYYKRIQTKQVHAWQSNWMVPLPSKSTHGWK